MRVRPWEEEGGTKAFVESPRPVAGEEEGTVGPEAAVEGRPEEGGRSEGTVAKAAREEDPRRRWRAQGVGQGYRAAKRALAS